MLNDRKALSIIMNKLLTKIDPRRLIVSLCIFAVCIGTQQIQTAKWDTGLIEFSRDSLGVLMAVIIMTNYKWSDFKKYKIPYIIWSVSGVVLGVLEIPIAFEKRLDFFKADSLIVALGIFLMGYCVIHTLISLFIEKYRPKFFMPLFVIWVIMLLLMIFSRSDYLWPECYFVLFLSYYATEQTPEQRINVMKGLVDGIILGFVLIQAHSLLFRPYDRLRYCGNFCNPNNNSIFLCFCLVAILAKILILSRENASKIVRGFYFLMAGACYSFICMTMSRSGYMTAVVVTFFFLAAYSRIKERKIFIRTGLLLVLLFMVLLPPTYFAVRYIPTIHPHVLFYFQEGYSEERVHSWDDRESPKYITFQQMIQGIFGRFGNLVVSYNTFGNVKTDEEIGSVKTSLNDEIPSIAADAGNEKNTQDVESDPDKIPVLTREEARNSIIVRYTIYKWFFTHLSLRGMPYDEQGFQLAEEYWVQHAHDIYLDYGINFGYPVMILFIVFIWWGIGRLTRRGLKERDVFKLSGLLIALIPPVFGLFEFAWGVSTISTVALYLVFKEMLVE